MSNRTREFLKLDRLLNPKSVSIVGIKPNIQYGAVLDNMLEHGFDRDQITLVNPFHPEVQGIPCIPKVPRGTDVAFLLLRAQLVPDVVRELVDLEVGAAVVIASGFAERGEEGRARQQVLRELSEQIAICGPNTMGAGNLTTGSVLFGAVLPSDLKSGNVAAVFQSGGMTSLFLQLAAARGIGVSTFVVTGNEVGASAADYINYLADDNATSTIALYFESIQNGRLLREAVVRAHANGKRIVALVAGRTEPARATVATHSGNIAAGLRWLNILEGLGVAAVSTFDELIETVSLFVMTPAIRSPRVQLLTVSGGESTWMTDLADEVGISLPPISSKLRSRLTDALGRGNFVGNPMDVGGLIRGPKPEQFGEVVRACCEESDTEVVGFRLNLPTAFNASLAESYRLCAEETSRVGRVCVFFTRASEPIGSEWRDFFRSLGVPLLQEMKRSLRAISLRARVESLDVGDRNVVPNAASATGICVGTHLLGDLRPVLEARGLRTVFERTIVAPDELSDALRAANGPVVMKLESPALLHKSDSKAVLLNITGEAAATAAYNELRTLALSLGIDDPKIIVQEQINDAVELLFGGFNDTEMGPTIVISHGGVFAEVFEQPSVWPAPVSLVTAQEMIHRLSGVQILGNYRGLGACDLEAVARAIVCFSQFLAEDAPEGSQWDLNPVMVRRGVQGDDAAVIVDALGIVAASLDA